MQHKGFPARSAALRIRCVVVAVFVAGLIAAQMVSPTPVRAEEGWNLALTDSPYVPSRFLAIDKDDQQLFLLSQHSPVAVKGQFVCSTGQVPGDKFREGDLRTPEGVYFVERKLDSGLNYDLYGTLAYTLNFPNPMDKLKGKTGSGIWVHGRGHAVTPRETQGCVAMNNPDLLSLQGEMEIGMPVVIAKEFTIHDDQTDLETLRRLVTNVESWALSWRAKSHRFFDYYNPERFTKASGEPFQGFKDHKLGLFERLPWIQVTVHDMQVLPGPDYWVTWFGQYYRTNELETEGVKRLYWQKDEQGTFRIVGKEWERRDLGLRREYLAQMQVEMQAFVDSWRSQWQAANLNEYISFYVPDATQDKREGRDAIRDQKAELWSRSRPEKVSVRGMAVDMHPEGLMVSFVQEYEAEGDYSDLGRKTMIVRPEGGSWRIVSENWEEL